MAGDEGDDAAVIVRPKELSPSMTCPMLNETNYSVWALRMKVLLRIHKVWETIEPGSLSLEKNDVATGLIFQSIPEYLVLQVGEKETAKEIWDAIKTRNLGAERVKEARLQTLNADFERLTMKDTESVEHFAGKLSEIASKSTSLGQTIEESKLVKKFLNSLPTSKYIQIAASLEQVLDLNKTSYEDIVGRLKAYEERIRHGEIYGGTQDNLLYANTEDWSDTSSSGGRGRGRGNRGRGRGRFNSQQRSTNQGEQNKSKEKKDLSKIICYRCDKPGHYASSCPERTQKVEEANMVETEEADHALYMHEIVFLEEENLIPRNYETKRRDEGVWYLDNGASNHMTGVKTFFSELNENIKGKVKFGDGSCVDIVGKGTIVFVGKTGEKRALREIYYIPDLKNNIISLGQATENGCEVHMKGDTLSLRDSHGRLFVQVKRSPNHLYKTPMEISYQEEEANDNQDHNQVVNQDEPESQQMVTRYGHTISKPRYLHGEPESYCQAVSSKEWVDAMEGELDSIVRNKAWEFVDKPADENTIGLKWIFKIKRNKDGSIDKYKARLVYEVLEQATRCWNTKFDIEVLQGEDEIKIKQEGYARQVLTEVDLETCDPSMEFGSKISKTQEGEEAEYMTAMEAIAFTKNEVFHDKKQKVDILTKALARIKFVEMRSFIGVQDVIKTGSKLKREIVG